MKFLYLQSKKKINLIFYNMEYLSLDLIQAFFTHKQKINYQKNHTNNYLIIYNKTKLKPTIPLNSKIKNQCYKTNIFNQNYV